MGIENFKLSEAVTPFEDNGEDLEQKEKEVMEKVKAIFRENAELNRLLLNKEDVDLSDHQARYLTGQLTGFRRDTQGVIKNLRSAVPLRYKKAA